MKFLFMIIFLGFELFAGVYYAKVEPVEKYTIKSAISGKVLNSLSKEEGRVSSGKVVVQLDDLLNQEDLRSSKLKLETLNEMVNITKQNLGK